MIEANLIKNYKHELIQEGTVGSTILDSPFELKLLIKSSRVFLDFL